MPALVVTAGASHRAPVPFCASAGTSDRVLLLSGTLHSVLTSIFLILEKVSRDGDLASSNKSARTSRNSRDEQQFESQVCNAEQVACMSHCMIRPARICLCPVPAMFMLHMDA